MAKTELSGNPLIPFVLVAGILSGSLWRGGPADTGKAGGSGSGGNSDKADVVAAPASSISDLNPVLDSLDAALGDRGSADGSSLTNAASVTLALKGPARDRQVLDAMARLRNGLNQYSSASPLTTCGSDPTLQDDANVLAAAMLVDDGGESKTRAAEAKALLEEYQDWGLLAHLANGVKESKLRAGPDYSVDFIVATLPDYVDSNSGWLADAGLAATQSAMAEEGYLFDRARLVDWSRAAGPVVVLSGSRLHERQPGAIIFRKVDDKGRRISLQVVLTVLETPTAGVHQVALRNSLWFLRAWSACSNGGKAALKVLGPSFSGSAVSLATLLREPPFKAAFDPRVVITGSATADTNPALMQAFSDGATFKSTVQPTSVLKKQMAEYLKSINAGWSDGRGVALLSESNTAFGRDASPDSAPKNDVTETSPPDPLPHAKIFSFPLHIAQLRSDAPSLAQPGGPLLSAPTIPLNLSEATPPSDVIPALRPQLTSAVVALTVDSILDAIRHEKLSAVGIIATDDRDVLFLAREVKRALPDVQLFLLGTHGLYLHGDYVPYLRGALVASSYALTLANQPEIPSLPDRADMPEEPHRQPFPSMSAEGVFYAARTLVSLSGAKEANLSSLKYCTAPAQQNCVPVAPVSINVIGEDGYWTLPPAASARASAAGNALPGASDPIPPPGEIHVAKLPPLPLQFLIGAALVLVFVAAHLVMMVLIKRGDVDRKANRSFFELPLVRVWAPPVTFDYAASTHRLALRVCVALLSLAASWTVAIVLPFLLPESMAALVPVAVVVTFAGVAYTGETSYGSRRKLADALPPSPSGVARRSRTIAEWTGRLLLVGMVVTMALFAVLVYWTVRDAISGVPGRLTLSRMVGGGIVSPAAMTLCLAAAFYAAVFMGVRRLSLVGFGYGRLGGGSTTFGLFTGEPATPVGQPKQGSLAGMLDTPVQHIPTVYLVALLVILATAALSAKRVVAIDGKTFSLFVMAGTWTTLGLGLMQLTQGLALWHTARAHLKRLAHTPIEKRLHEISAQVPWEISLTPPRLTELVPVARMADAIMRDFRSIAFGAAGDRVLRDFGTIRTLRPDEEQRLGVRPLDFAGLHSLFAEPSHVTALENEMKDRQHAAIIQSTSWFDLWKLSDALVTLLQRTTWLRFATVAPAKKPQLVEIVGIPKMLRELLTPAALGTTPPPPIEPPRAERPDSGSSSEWFARCEQLVALQVAFVLRDIVARTIAYLFSAMLCLTALAAAHLLYVFSGRASLLTVDMLAIAGAAVSSVWILVDMERDHVLSRLRTTTPGRVDINWEFIKRIAVYGVLPLLAVIASLFPEVGGTLFGWLEPLRKLSAL